MKKLIVALALLLVIPITSCYNNQESYEEKPITGIEPIFKESLGYYNEFPSVIRVSNTLQYVYYTRNTVKYDNTTDSIAVRKASLVDGEWVYSEPKTVLLPSSEGWDSKHVFSPDVIKGVFEYNGETYNYLMAYAGSISENRMNAQIGFAVAKSPLDEFIKVGNEPIISFNKDEFSSTGNKDFKGVQEPSLISYDKKGKIQLFYSHYGVFNHSYCQEIDASNLNNLIKGGRMLSQVTGLSDSTVNTHLYSADWAYDWVNDEFVVVRNFSSTVKGLPNIAEAVQVVYAPVEAVYYVDNSREETGGEIEWWKLYSNTNYKIGAVKTADDSSDDAKKWNGYARVFNGTIVSDEYGWIINPNEVEILFTSSPLSDSMYLKEGQYLFAQMIHSYHLEKSLGE